MQCYVRVHRSPLPLRLGQQVERRNHLRHCTFLSDLVQGSLGVQVCERVALPFKIDCSGRSLSLAAKSDRAKGGTQASQPLTDGLPVAQKDMIYTYTPVLNSYSLLLLLLIPQLTSPACIALTSLQVKYVINWNHRCKRKSGVSRKMGQLGGNVSFRYFTTTDPDYQ